MSKARLAKLQQALNASDPELQPRALIVEYEKDGSVSIHPIGWSGTDVQAKEILSQRPYCEWVQIHNDIPRLSLPRPNGTLKVFTDTDY